MPIPCQRKRQADSCELCWLHKWRERGRKPRHRPVAQLYVVVETDLLNAYFEFILKQKFDPQILLIF